MGKPIPSHAPLKPKAPGFFRCSLCGAVMLVKVPFRLVDGFTRSFSGAVKHHHAAKHAALSGDPSGARAVYHPGRPK